MNLQLDTVVYFDAYQYLEGRFEKISVPLSAEYSMTIAINGKPFVTIACSGSELQELATGFLVAEGIITNKNEIEKIDFDAEKLIMDVTIKETDTVIQRLFSIRSIVSGCGNAAVKGTWLKKIKPGIFWPQVILKIGKQFYQTSDIHKLTHGVHSAGLYTATGECIVFYDEIGRHSAVDKIVGYALCHDIPLADKIVYSTGRISSDIILKAVAAGIGVVASKSAPTSLAAQYANEYHVVLAANVRINKFDVLTTSIDIHSIFEDGFDHEHNSVNIFKNP